MQKEHRAVYDGEKRLVGKVLRDENLQSVFLEAENGETYSVPNQYLIRQDEHWILTEPLSKFSKVEPPSHREEQQRVDEMSADSFPASDPPDYTLGKNETDR